MTADKREVEETMGSQLASRIAVIISVIIIGVIYLLTTAGTLTGAVPAVSYVGAVILIPAWRAILLRVFEG